MLKPVNLILHRIIFIVHRYVHIICTLMDLCFRGAVQKKLRLSVPNHPFQAILVSKHICLWAFVDMSAKNLSFFGRPTDPTPHLLKVISGVAFESTNLALISVPSERMTPLARPSLFVVIFCT